VLWVCRTATATATDVSNCTSYATLNDDNYPVNSFYTVSSVSVVVPA